VAAANWRPQWPRWLSMMLYIELWVGQARIANRACSAEAATPLGQRAWGGAHSAGFVASTALFERSQVTRLESSAPSCAMAEVAVNRRLSLATMESEVSAMLAILSFSKSCPLTYFRPTQGTKYKTCAVC